MIGAAITSAIAAFIHLTRAFFHHVAAFVAFYNIVAVIMYVIYYIRGIYISAYDVVMKSSLIG
jgi:fructose-specific phosphotransferase system IIC component